MPVVDGCPGERLFRVSLGHLLVPISVSSSATIGMAQAEELEPLSTLMTSAFGAFRSAAGELLGT